MQQQIATSSMHMELMLWYLMQGAMSRGDWYRTKDLIVKVGGVGSNYPVLCNCGCAAGVLSVA